ncbi:hypothetical protein, partial [Pseudomonas sp. GP01-A4]
SQPVPDNAIYQLADALKAVQGYEFPIKFTETTRAFFSMAALGSPAPLRTGITALLANPQDAAADKVVSSDKMMHSTLRTTCVATMVSAG